MGLCYNALWYFPTLIAIGGFATFVWEGAVKNMLAQASARLRRRRAARSNDGTDIADQEHGIAIASTASHAGLVQRRTGTPSIGIPIGDADGSQTAPMDVEPAQTEVVHKIRLSVGIALVLGFFVSFLTFMLVRGLVKPLPRILAVFSNMYLAGTIIFGGAGFESSLPDFFTNSMVRWTCCNSAASHLCCGPRLGESALLPPFVVLTLIPSQVSSRDFLIGLAIIQAMPGPNFNFAVYLGALAVQRTSAPTIVGAILGFIGIFTPGLVLAVAIQSFWSVLRSRKWVIDILRGINATAVGLVFTAVYRLFEIGYLTSEGQGKSLGLEPFWVVVTVLVYAESAWFKVPPAVAIVFGAVLGLCWYGAVQA